MILKLSRSKCYNVYVKIIRFDSVCIWSENPDELAKFYEEKIGLIRKDTVDLPDDYGHVFMLSDVMLFIGHHSEVKGTAKDPYRIMPGFWTDSVNEVYGELSKKGVEFIRKPSVSPDGTYYAATIKDPEGNIIQFFSEKP